MQRRNVHRWQRLSTLIIGIFVLVLLWPFFSMRGVKELWLSTRFSIPDRPEIQQHFLDEKSMPRTVVVVLKSRDPKLLLQLQQAGWPAYLADNKIYIGPYLDSFRSQIDLTKIRQVTSIAATIESN